jgi:hypothetical protein
MSTQPQNPDVDPSVPPSGEGCVECLAADGWWVHLRRCARCGHIGCCDSSPAQHATAHFRETGHRVVRSFEPGEEWFYDYGSGEYVDAPDLAPPQAHPAAQPAPGPAGKVPADWRDRVH